MVAQSVTWTEVGGTWSVYVDGKTNVRRSGNFLRQDHALELNGAQLMLSQKVEHSAFQERHAFTNGNISLVVMWDYFTSMEDVNKAAIKLPKFSNERGEVLRFSDRFT